MTSLRSPPPPPPTPRSWTIGAGGRGECARRWPFEKGAWLGVQSPPPTPPPRRGPALSTPRREAIGLAAAPRPRWTPGRAQWAWPEGVARREAGPRALSQ